MKKKGISLIVLIITIIVMVILTTVIILKLTGVQLNSKAKEAKNSTTMANLEDAATLFYSEFVLANSEADEDEIFYSEAQKYVRNKLVDKGFNSDLVKLVRVTENTVVLPGELATKIVQSGAKIGDTVKGYDKYSAYDDTDEWKYMGIDNDGNIVIVGDVTGTQWLSKQAGYLNGITILNSQCDTKYSSSMGIARNMNIDDIFNLIEYKGSRFGYYDATDALVMNSELKTIGDVLEINWESNIYTPDSDKSINEYPINYVCVDVNDYNILKRSYEYWISSQGNCLYCSQDRKYVDFGLYTVNSSGKLTVRALYTSKNGGAGPTLRLRPVVTLSSNVKIKYDKINKTIKLS